MHYTKSNKTKIRVTCYTEVSLQQQAVSEESIESGVATFFKESLFFLFIRVTLHHLSLLPVKISCLFSLLYYKYLTINTFSMNATVCLSGV